MKKILLSILTLSATHFAFADTTESATTTTVTPSAVAATAAPAPVTNSNDSYINSNAFLQNPFSGIASGGGTQVVDHNTYVNQSFAQRLFSDGTYNVYAGGITGTGSSGTPGGTNSLTTGVGASIYMQSGQVLGGFSVGGLLNVMNPFVANELNGRGSTTRQYNAMFDPSNDYIAVSEAFLEYQYGNRVNADIGLIGINNSPWLAANFYNNMLAPGATYQGAVVNVNAGNGWVLTGIGFNGLQTSGQVGFTGNTFFNTNNQNYGNSSGTVALGANYMADNNNYNLRLWGYNFDNFGTLLYADNSLKLNLSNSQAFNIAAQVGTDNGQTQSNLVGFNSQQTTSANSSNQISSNFFGLQFGYQVDWLNLNLAYTTIAAGNGINPNSTIGGGAIVSPYTTNLGVDPLYAEGWQTNYVNLGIAGSLYKISPGLSFQNGNLTITPNFIYGTSSDADFNGVKEANVVVNYAIPEVRGLFVFGVFSQQWRPDTVNNEQSNNISPWTSSVALTYTY